ncbi:MAG: ketosteroid isomerase-related protein [Polyangiales bacterium]
MSRELIDQYYRAFNAADHAGMLALLADDVVHDINQGAREEGKQRFAAFLEHMKECYDEQLTDIAVMSDPDGKRVAAEFMVQGKYLKADPGLPPATGQTYRLPAGAFFEVRSGKISRVTTYYNLNDWLAMVGA